MKNKKIIYRFILLLLILLLLFITNILRGYYGDNSYLVPILRLMYLIVFWFVAIKKIILSISIRKPLNLLLVLLIPLFWWLFLTTHFNSKQIALRIESENQKEHGFYVLIAKKEDFSFLLNWPYTLIINDHKLYLQGTGWLPNSNDTILVGVLKEGKSWKHFIFNEHPTRYEIEHAKQGWYIEGDTKSKFNAYKFNLFKKVVLNNDSIAREDGKPKNKYDR